MRARTPFSKTSDTDSNAPTLYRQTDQRAREFSSRGSLDLWESKWYQLANNVAATESCKWGGRNMIGEKLSDASTARLVWIEQAYTIIALFCFTWAVSVIMGIYTRGTPTLPIIGAVVYTEFVVYTLYAFSFLLPLLLGVIIWYRAALSGAGLSRRLPFPRLKNIGAAGAPAAFRATAFIVLVGVPIFAEQLAYQRLYGEISIVWKPKKWWKTEDYRVQLAHEGLFTFPTKPEMDRDYANWRFAKFPDVDSKSRSRNREDEDGRPDWAREKERVQISAAPGFLPWLFRLTAYGSAAVMLWLVLTAKGPPRWTTVILRKRQTKRSLSSNRRKRRTLVRFLNANA